MGNRDDMKKRQILRIMIYTLFFTALIPLSQATIMIKDDAKEIYFFEHEPLRVATGIVIGRIHGGYNEQSRTIDADFVYIFCTFVNSDLRGFFSGELKIEYCGILTENFICAHCCIYPGGW